MSKNDKRTYNKSHFEEKILSNRFLNNYIKKTGTTFNKKQLRVNCLIGWKLINYNDDSDDDTIIIKKNNLDCDLDL
jgi:hypothetical protein